MTTGEKLGVAFVTTVSSVTLFILVKVVIWMSILQVVFGN